MLLARRASLDRHDSRREILSPSQAGQGGL